MHYTRKTGCRLHRLHTCLEHIKLKALDIYHEQVHRTSLGNHSVKSQSTLLVPADFLHMLLLLGNSTAEFRCKIDRKAWRGLQQGSKEGCVRIRGHRQRHRLLVRPAGPSQHEAREDHGQSCSSGARACRQPGCTPSRRESASVRHSISLTPLRAAVCIPRIRNPWGPGVVGDQAGHQLHACTATWNSTCQLHSKRQCKIGQPNKSRIPPKD